MDERQAPAGGSAPHIPVLYREALETRHRLQTGEQLEWVETGDPEVLHFVRPNGWAVVTNFGSEPVPYPVAGTVVLSSGASLADGVLTPDDDGPTRVGADYDGGAVEGFWVFEGEVGVLEYPAN